MSTPPISGSESNSSRPIQPKPRLKENVIAKDALERLAEGRLPSFGQFEKRVRAVVTSDNLKEMSPRELDFVEGSLAATKASLQTMKKPKTDDVSQIKKLDALIQLVHQEKEARRKGAGSPSSLLSHSPFPSQQTPPIPLTPLLEEPKEVAKEIVSRALLGEPAQPCTVEKKVLSEAFSTYLKGLPQKELQEGIRAMVDHADLFAWKAMRDALLDGSQTVKEAINAVARELCGSKAKETLRKPSLKNDAGRVLSGIGRLFELGAKNVAKTIGTGNVDALAKAIFQGSTFLATLQHTLSPKEQRDSIVSHYRRMESVQIGDRVVPADVEGGSIEGAKERTDNYREKLVGYLMQKGVQDPEKVADELMLRCCGDMNFGCCCSDILPYFMTEPDHQIIPVTRPNIGRLQPEMSFSVQDGMCVVKQTFLLKDQTQDKKIHRFAQVDLTFVLDPTKPIKNQWEVTVATSPYSGKALADEVIRLEREEGKTRKEASAKVEGEIMKDARLSSRKEKDFFLDHLHRSLSRLKS